MNAFWEGLIAGYGIAIPVGAIAVLIVDLALRRGFRLGFAAGAGAASADLLYAGAAVIAGAAFASALRPFAALIFAALSSASVSPIVSGGGCGKISSSVSGFFCSRSVLRRASPITP